MDAKAIEGASQVIVNKSAPSTQADPPKVATPPSPKPLKLEDDSVTLSNFVKEEVKPDSNSGVDFQRKLSITANNQVVMKLIDPKTKEVVRQTPPEEQVRLSEAIRNAAEKF